MVLAGRKRSGRVEALWTKQSKALAAPVDRLARRNLASLASYGLAGSIPAGGFGTLKKRSP